MTRRKSSRRSQSRRNESNFIQSLLRLKKLKARDRSQAISMANDRFIRQLCHHVKKLKYAKLSTKDKKSLQKHRKSLRSLISNRSSMSKRRKILSQHGGGILGGILKSLKYLPIVGSVYDMISGN